MTDKQIIIDGVNVSGCRAYYKEHDITDMCSLADGLTCKENPNCYYKQLKRKEQECEELTSKCSQLEEEIKDWQKEVERIQFIGSYGIMDEEKKNLAYEIACKNEQLSKTLTEIKEICKKERGWVNCSNNMPTETAIFAKQILQKISECEGNDENL